MEFDKEAFKKTVASKIENEIKSIHSKIGDLSHKILSYESSPITESHREIEEEVEYEEEEEETPRVPSFQKQIFEPKSDSKPLKNAKTIQNVDYSNKSIDDYERKLEILLSSLSEYNLEAMAIEESSNPNFIILKRNFDMLLTVFEEAEAQRKSAFDELHSLSATIDEFRTECELKMDDEKLKVIELQKRLRNVTLVGKNGYSEGIAGSYEKEITELRNENQELKNDNHRLINECLTKNNISEGKFKNEILRKLKRLEKDKELADKEISVLRSQQRAFTSSKSVLKSINNKNASLSKALSDKDLEINRIMTDLHTRESQFMDIKEAFTELETQFTNLSSEYLSLCEKFSLEREKAKEKAEIKEKEPIIVSETPKAKKTPNKRQNYREKREKIFKMLTSLE